MTESAPDRAGASGGPGAAGAAGGGDGADISSEAPEGAVHPWRRPGGGPPISARTAMLLVAMVFMAGVAVGYLLAVTA